MKISVRRGIFETNSSSVHSLTMCTKSDFDKWKNGELVWCRSDGELIPMDDKDYQEWNVLPYEEKECYWEYFTYDEFFNDYEKMEYEVYSQNYTSPNKEEIVGFGYYGHD